MDLFKNRTKLNEHKRLEHNTIKNKVIKDGIEIECESFICNHKGCKKEFGTLGKLNRHKKIHLLKYECEICHAKFGQNWDLKMHKRIHNKNKCEICPHCGKSFIHPSTKRNHIRSVHEKAMTKEKPYKCHICHKAFVKLSKFLCIFFFFFF